MLGLYSPPRPRYVYSEYVASRRPVNRKRIGKRAFDICAALIVTVGILWWMLPLLGLLIKLESPGPVLFIQKRTGHRGRWFNCLKFRTMTYNPRATFEQATRKDSRVTALGRFLRKTNLDEMPQFLNVLIGDMSVVGPRPHALEHSAQYWNTMPDYRKRYREKPGITGLAQVRGCRGETDHPLKMEHRVKLDRFYRRKRSLSIDLWICWLTLKSMLKGNADAW